MKLRVSKQGGKTYVYPDFRYAGLTTFRFMGKYSDCEVVRVGGGRVRKLSDTELSKFREHMNNLCEPKR